MKFVVKNHLLPCCVDLPDTFLADVDDFLIVEPSGVALLGAQDALHDVVFVKLPIDILALIAFLLE